MMKPRKWSLVLVPDHLGVIHVRGRVGADQGPAAFERVFNRLSGERNLLASCGARIRLEGLDGPIETNHRQAADAVREAHLASGLSVVVGGGHDHGYSHLKGLTEATPVRWGCINIDAHLDVRKPEPHPTSGSPFYLCLEDGVLRPEDLVEFGIQSHCNGPALWEYVRAKGVRVVALGELRAPGEALRRFESELSALADRVDAIAISLDLDALAEAHCPGVSAPQAEGLSSSAVMAMLESAGRHPKVASLGIFELNPAHDLGDATARVAATGAHHFIQASLEAAEAEAAGEAGFSS